MGSWPSTASTVSEIPLSPPPQRTLTKIQASPRLQKAFLAYWQHSSEQRVRCATRSVSNLNGAQAMLELVQALRVERDPEAVAAVRAAVRESWEDGSYPVLPALLFATAEELLEYCFSQLHITSYIKKTLLDPLREQLVEVERSVLDVIQTRNEILVWHDLQTLDEEIQAVVSLVMNGQAIHNLMQSLKKQLVCQGGLFPVFVEMRPLEGTPRGQFVYAPEMGFMHTRLRIGEYILDPACYPDKQLWVAIQRTPDVLEVTEGDIAAGASCVPPFQVPIRKWHLGWHSDVQAELENWVRPCVVERMKEAVRANRRNIDAQVFRQQSEVILQHFPRVPVDLESVSQSIARALYHRQSSFFTRLATEHFVPMDNLGKYRTITNCCQTAVSNCLQQLRLPTCTHAMKACRNTTTFFDRACFNDNRQIDEGMSRVWTNILAPTLNGSYEWCCSLEYMCWHNFMRMLLRAQYVVGRCQVRPPAPNVSLPQLMGYAKRKDAKTYHTFLELRRDQDALLDKFRDSFSHPVFGAVVACLRSRRDALDGALYPAVATPGNPAATDPPTITHHTHQRMLTLRLKSTLGREGVIQVPAGASVGELKQLIAACEGTPMTDQRLKLPSSEEALPDTHVIGAAADEQALELEYESKFEYLMDLQHVIEKQCYDMISDYLKASVRFTFLADIHARREDLERALVQTYEMFHEPSFRCCGNAHRGSRS